MRRRSLDVLLSCLIAGIAFGVRAESPEWASELVSLRREAVALEADARAKYLCEASRRLRKDHPVEMDWMSQDWAAIKGWPDEVDKNGCLRVLDTWTTAEDETNLVSSLLGRVARELEGGEDTRFGDLEQGLTRYLEACERRREARLTLLRAEAPRIAFIKRHPVKPSFFAYTEGQSDAQAERHFNPGSKLCVLDVRSSRGKTETWLDDPGGVIRDLDVSWGGDRILFAWKKSDREDDYHLYEMNATDRSVRTITRGKGLADFEGRYLPSGDLVFSSSRCVQTVDCWWTEVSNMYTCDADGRYLRRLGFDQVHTVYPAVLNNGTVAYTRWDYNDRGQVYPQGLFVMNADGTAQRELYGNNSWFPTVINHTRAIPGTSRLLAVLHGHHSWQAGQLAVIDPTQGTQEAEGVQLVAPERETKSVRVDRYGQFGRLYRHPYPLSEEEYLVTMTADPQARQRGEHFGLYLVRRDGRRELLAWDDAVSCAHPMPLRPRPCPPVRPSLVDYAKKTGTYYVQDIYVGPGLEGVARGSITKLRVVALEFRAAGVGRNSNRGKAGGAMVSTPISIGNGSWDVKRVVGEADVYEDGSAMFEAPARTPLYFQAVDEQGGVAQTMRSWSTLMPGETLGCVGCHESKQTTPSAQRRTIAMQRGTQKLHPFYGPPRGFSFSREVQPILDRNCTSCHDGKPHPETDGKALASLTADEYLDKQAKRKWSHAYLTLTGAQHKGAASGDSNRPLVNWIDAQSIPPLLPPYFKGAAKSGLVTMLRDGHKGVKLSREELDKICAWIDLGVPFCADYREAADWSKGEIDKYDRYETKRLDLAAEDEAACRALAERAGR